MTIKQTDMMLLEVAVDSKSALCYTQKVLRKRRPVRRFPFV